MRVGVIQMTSTDDLSANLKAARELVATAAERGAEFISMPENFAFMRREGSAFPCAQGFDGEIVGCVGLRDSGGGKCEMKRMYVQPEYRGKGLGRALGERLISEARDIGYTHMRLDTVPAMEAAVGLYISLGFKEIEPYRFNPYKEAMFLELDLG